MQPNVLILGLGNLLVRDEGLGVCALELLQERYNLPEGVTCIDGGVLGLELLALEKLMEAVVGELRQWGMTAMPKPTAETQC